MDIEEIIGIGFFLLLICCLIGIPIWACNASLSNEINPSEYTKLEDLLDRYPELHSIIDKSLENNKITRSEYCEIKQELDRLRQSNSLVSLKRKSWLACQKVCSQVEEKNDE